MGCCEQAVKKVTQRVRDNIGYIGNVRSGDAETTRTDEIILKTLEEVETQWAIMQITMRKKSAQLLNTTKNS